MHHDPHNIGWLHEWWHNMLDNPQVALAIIGGLAGWMMWWMRSVFVTQRTMNEINDKNTADHEEIKGSIHTISKDVSWIKGFMERHHGDNDN
jgi:hypothetical protein